MNYFMINYYKSMGPGRVTRDPWICSQIRICSQTLPTALRGPVSYRCIVSINVLWLFFTVMWVRLQCVIMVFPDHTHLLFAIVNVPWRFLGCGLVCSV